MAIASPSMDVKEDLKCPICMEYLTSPVSVDCGHNFCKGCITKYYEVWEDLGDLECPLCKAKMRKINFRPNWQLASIVEKIKRISLNLGENDLCEKHNEKLNLFCKEDQKLVCVFCERSPEHVSHTVILSEEAAKECKSQFCSYLEILRREKERILAIKTVTQMESEFLLGQIEEKKTRTVAASNQLHQLLEEQKSVLLSQLEELEKETATRSEEHMARLMEKLSSLEGLIHQMEEKCQQPASELLQDIRSTLQRYRNKPEFENPVVFPPELTSRIGEFHDVKSLLEAVMKQLQEGEELMQKMLPKESLLTEEFNEREVSKHIDESKIKKSQSLDGNQPRFPMEPKNKDDNFMIKIRNLTLKTTMFKKGRRRDPGNDRQASLTYVQANVTLDPDTAHPQLILSEDCKSLSEGDQWQDLPNNPERFDFWPFVLGREEFTAGRRFWDVTVGSEEPWAVGVARKSVKRKGMFDVSPEEGIWVVMKWRGEYITHDPPDNTLSFSQELKKIRVMLNYDDGQVAFSNADTGLHLYTYTGASFQGEIILPFFHVSLQAHLKLSP